MAWQCSGRSNAELVERLAQAGYAKHKRVVAAMTAIDRAWFAPNSAYEDRPVPIGHNATISAPHMHAHALSVLEPKLQPGMAVLDVGSGSGYLTACMAHMVSPSGKVVGIEHVSALVQDSERSLATARRHHGEKMAPTIMIAGDGRLGAPDHGPYDCIHVGAAAPNRPDALLSQLKADGLLYTPEVVQYGEQVIALYRKLPSGSLERTELLPVRYVPLTNLKDQVGSH